MDQLVRLTLVIVLQNLTAFRMVTIVAAAVKSSAWEGSDGIITEGSSPGSNNDDVGFKGTSSMPTVS